MHKTVKSAVLGVLIWLPVGLAVAASEPSPAVSAGTFTQPPSIETQPGPLMPLLQAATAPAQLPDSLDWEGLQAHYARNGYRPIWLRAHDGVMLPGASAWYWMQTLNSASGEGLDPARYHIDEIRALWARDDAISREHLELLLTDAFLKYAVEVRVGRLGPGQADPEWHIEPSGIDPGALLLSWDQTGRLGQLLEQLPPPHPGYHGLRGQLASYRAIEKAGGWPHIAPGPKLEPGMRDQEVALLRDYLAVTGDLPHSIALAGMFEFDAELEQAVRRFQQRHGLDVDGIVGRDTRAAMAVPVAERIRQIELAMERWRWLPRDLGERYLLVNMAGFEMELVEQGQPTLQMRVIVGRPYRSTPAFASRLNHLVVNPYWNVPNKLAGLDILPEQRKDDGYLARKQIRVFSDWSAEAVELDASRIDWAEVPVKPFPYKLRQDPGPQNSLGRIKFMFPNDFAIYLHDTPARGLFDKPSRAYSSGCIRLEKPVELAAHLLQSGEQGPEAFLPVIQERIDGGDTQTIRLAEPVPIYLAYWTSWVARDGTLHFRDDIYGRDARLARAW